ncbi:MAG TPA: phosphoribosyltransferase [Anaerolineales bacterium]|nr:phosphoribosyltransferase [Anaerolineales bacterium]
MKRFFDRRDAGRQLASRLGKYAYRQDVILLALPRGGVPVAYEVADTLKAPLDVFIVRKLGLPGKEELAIGAIASGGTRILNEEIIRALHIDRFTIDEITERERLELQRRERQYREDRPAPEVLGRTVILIDDGLATGASMMAAIHALRTRQPTQIIVAVPVAAPQAIRLLRPRVDEAVYVIAPEHFEGVGKWYEDFSQTTDEEVQTLLSNWRNELPRP